MSRHRLGESYNKNVLKNMLSDDDFIYHDKVFYDQLSREELISELLRLTRRYNKIIEDNAILKLSNNHIIRVMNMKNNKHKKE